MTTVLIEIEGQKIPVDENIARDDDLLRKLFAPYYPDAANARIDREQGELIKIIKTAGTKGNGSILETLLTAPEEVNPAVYMCRLVQQRELTSDLGYSTMKQMAQEIETAIELGITEIETVRRSLDILKKSSPTTGAAPIGF